MVPTGSAVLHVSAQRLRGRVAVHPSRRRAWERRRKHRDRVDAIANRLYDRLNPDADVVINVPKDECVCRVVRIALAMKRK